MAKYNVTSSCGHTEEHQLTGPGKQREWRIAQLERGVCAECYKAERLKNEKAQVARINEVYPDLPALTGTPNQIEWAERIRAKAIPALMEVVGKRVAIPEFVDFGRKIMARTDAEYWIDRRAKFQDANEIDWYITRRLKEEDAKKKGAEALGLGGKP